MKRDIEGNLLTEDMNRIIDLALEGKDICITGMAGSGKKTIVHALDKYLSKKGIFLSQERNVGSVSNIHFKENNISHVCAYSFVMEQLEQSDVDGFTGEGRLRVISYNEMVDALNINENGKVEKLFQIKEKYHFIIAIAESYYVSSSIKITHLNIPSNCNNYINQLYQNKKIKQTEMEEVKEMLLNYARILVAKQISPYSNIPTSNNAVLKFFHLERKPITKNVDYIVLGNAQNSWGVIYSIVINQPCQKIIIGDKYQGFATFDGVHNALETTYANKVNLLNSFRYGQDVAGMVGKLLAHHHEPDKVKGFGFNTEVIKASNFEGVSERLLYISRSYESIFKAAIDASKVGVAFLFISDWHLKRAIEYLDCLADLEKEDSVIIEQYEYKNVGQVALEAREPLLKSLAEFVSADQELGKLLLAALSSSEKTGENAALILSTADESIRFDVENVLVADDFYSVISSFTSGEKLDESELFLIYTAISRANKSLVISDKLFQAIRKNANFCINKNRVQATIFDKGSSDFDKGVRRNGKAKKGATSVNDNKNLKNGSTKKDKDLLENIDFVGVKEKRLSVKNEKVEITADKKVKPKAKTSFSNEINNDRKVTNKKKGSLPIEKDSENKIMSFPTIQRVGRGIKVVVGRKKEAGRSINDLPIVYWEPTDKGSAKPHLCIVNEQGKAAQIASSIVTQVIMSRHLNGGYSDFPLIILDAEGEFLSKKFIALNSIDVIKPFKLTVNPFELLDKKNKKAPIVTALNFIEIFSSFYSISEYEKEELKRSIALAYSERGIENNQLDTFNSPCPTFKDVFEKLRSPSPANDNLHSLMKEIHLAGIFHENPKKCKGLRAIAKAKAVTLDLSGVDIARHIGFLQSILLSSYHAESISENGAQSPEKLMDGMIVINQSTKDRNSINKIKNQNSAAFEQSGTPLLVCFCDAKNINNDITNNFGMIISSRCESGVGVLNEFLKKETPHKGEIKKDLLSLDGAESVYISRYGAGAYGTQINATQQSLELWLEKEKK